MENKYYIKGDYAYIEVPYKKNIVTVKIDKEDIQKASSIQGRWILVRKTQRTDLFYFVCNKDKTISLHKLLKETSKDDTVYFKDNDYTNVSKSNLTINTYETDEAFRQKRKKAYQEMSAKGKENLINGMRINRYSKDWATKLSISKKGKYNPKVVLNEKLVREIRKVYATKNFTQKMLAEYYRVGRTTIADIVNYRTWNEIGEDPNKEYRIYTENKIISFDVNEVSIEYLEFNNHDILREDFVIQLECSGVGGFIFVQKIGEIKLYVEVRNSTKKFVHSFEIVFPEFLTPLHIHNYIITQRKPVRLMNRYSIHSYMRIISSFLFKDTIYNQEQVAMNL